MSKVINYMDIYNSLKDKKASEMNKLLIVFSKFYEWHEKDLEDKRGDADGILTEDTTD